MEEAQNTASVIPALSDRYAAKLAARKRGAAVRQTKERTFAIEAVVQRPSASAASLAQLPATTLPAVPPSPCPQAPPPNALAGLAHRVVTVVPKKTSPRKDLDERGPPPASSSSLAAAAEPTLLTASASDLQNLVADPASDLQSPIAELADAPQMTDQEETEASVPGSAALPALTHSAPHRDDVAAFPESTELQPSTDTPLVSERGDHMLLSASNDLRALTHSLSFDRDEYVSNKNSQEEIVDSSLKLPPSASANNVEPATHPLLETPSAKPPKPSHKRKARQKTAPPSKDTMSEQVPSGAAVRPTKRASKPKKTTSASKQDTPSSIPPPDDSLPTSGPRTRAACRAQGLVPVVRHQWGGPSTVTWRAL
ncbi:hypothetical protein HDU86_004219 [Geranomyces michiganensis]|nr:hypothetical protein HDU86_004219 [Geranomyces michiganensis]